MPDVGLFTATEPLSSSMKVVIKYSGEVEGPPVYNESYDVDTLARELKEDRNEVSARWLRRVECVVKCRSKEGFSACVTRCLTDGQACDCGSEKGKSD